MVREICLLHCHQWSLTSRVDLRPNHLFRYTGVISLGIYKFREDYEAQEKIRGLQSRIEPHQQYGPRSSCVRYSSCESTTSSASASPDYNEKTTLLPVVGRGRATHGSSSSDSEFPEFTPDELPRQESRLVEMGKLFFMWPDDRQPRR